MICVPNLRQGIEAYTRIGFGIQPGGDHTSGGTHNAIAFFRDDYLELLAVREGQQQQAGAALLEFLAKGGGLRYIALQSDDLAADVAAMRTRGVDVSDPDEGGRRTPAGQELRWRSARLGPTNPLPVFLLQHLSPLAGRRRRDNRGHSHGPRAASATQASRRCSSSRRTPAASTSACSARPKSRLPCEAAPALCRRSRAAGRRSPRCAHPAVAPARPRWATPTSAPGSRASGTCRAAGAPAR